MDVEIFREMIEVSFLEINDLYNTSMGIKSESEMSNDDIKFEFYLYIGRTPLALLVIWHIAAYSDVSNVIFISHHNKGAWLILIRQTVS